MVTVMGEMTRGAARFTPGVAATASADAAATTEKEVKGPLTPRGTSQRSVPMLATVAQQEARATADNLQRMLKGEAPEAFHYKDPGLLATIGRNAAVARIAGLSFSGFIAWVIWVVLHIYRLIGFRNRLVVLINWAWDYIFYESQVRLITKD